MIEEKARAMLSIPLLPGTHSKYHRKGNKEEPMIRHGYLGGGGHMTKKDRYSSGPFTPDELRFIEIAPTKVLVAVARGEINLNRIARQALASRGLGLNGEWVGFQKAREIHELDE